LHERFTNQFVQIRRVNLGRNASFKSFQMVAGTDAFAIARQPHLVATLAKCSRSTRRSNPSSRRVFCSGKYFAGPKPNDSVSAPSHLASQLRKQFRDREKILFAQHFRQLTGINSMKRIATSLFPREVEQPENFASFFPRIRTVSASPDSNRVLSQVDAA